MWPKQVVNNSHAIPTQFDAYVIRSHHIFGVVLGACFAFLIVEFVLFMIVGLLLSRGGKENLGNGEFALSMIISSLLTTAIAYYYIVATLDDTCVMFCN